MRNTIRVILKIYRFDESRPGSERYQSYHIPCGPQEPLLSVLQRLKEEQDGSLTFRRSCRHGICGSCAVRVETQPLLACKMPMGELIDRFGTVLKVEPLRTNRAVRDLVMDESAFWDAYDQVKPFLLEVGESSSKKDPKEADPPAQETLAQMNLRDSEVCIQCGICYSACPVVRVMPSFLGPAALTKLYRFVEDPRDRAEVQRLELANTPRVGVWDCVKCYHCVQACPKGVAPYEQITALHLATAKNPLLKKHTSQRYARGFYNSIRFSGYLNEIYLALYSLRFRFVRYIPNGMRMIFQRKTFPFVSIPRSKKMKEIRTLLKEEKE